MKFLYKLHLLSLDVVAGAMISSLMFWKLPDGFGKINLPSIIILGVATWLIYLLDRLLDVRKNADNSTFRHQFHLQNQRKIFWLIIVLFLVAAILVFFLPKQVFLFGIIVSVLVGIYLFTLNSFSQSIDYQEVKEPIVAIVYTLAVVGSAYSLRQSIDIKSWVLAINFFIVAMQNLLLFSFFEHQENPKANNITLKIGKQKSKVLIAIFFGIVVASSVAFRDTFNYEAKVLMVEMAMSSILLLIGILPNVFLKNERYRWLGDGVFLLPILLIFFS